MENIILHRQHDAGCIISTGIRTHCLQDMQYSDTFRAIMCLIQN
jgi:hypothetical protein